MFDYCVWSPAPESTPFVRDARAVETVKDLKHFLRKPSSKHALVRCAFANRCLLTPIARCAWWRIGSIGWDVRSSFQSLFDPLR